MDKSFYSVFFITVSYVCACMSNTHARILDCKNTTIFRIMQIFLQKKNIFLHFATKKETFCAKVSF